MVTRTNNSRFDSITAAGGLDKLTSGSGILNIVKRYLFKAFKEAGLTLDEGKSKQNDDGSITHKMTFIYQPTEEDEKKEFVFYVNGLPTDEDKKYVDLSFKYPDLKADPSGKTMKEEMDRYKNVPNTNEEILKRIQYTLDQAVGVDTLEDVPENLTSAEESSTSVVDIDSCKLLNFTVNKVSAATRVGYKLQFSNICANYSPSDIKADINSIAGDADFVNDLKSGHPTSFGVLVTDDDYNIEEFDEQSLQNLQDSAIQLEYIDIAYNNILDQAYKLYCDSKFFCYTACGSDREKIMSFSDNFSWKLQNIIDTMSRRLVEHKLFLENPFGQIRRSTNPTIYNNQNPKWEDFETVMCQDIQELVLVMTLYSSNLPKDEEAEVLEWIRSWNSELNYNLQRSEP